MFSRPHGRQQTITTPFTIIMASGQAVGVQSARFLREACLAERSIQRVYQSVGAAGALWRIRCFRSAVGR
jgi:hypothetical protein